MTSDAAIALMADMLWACVLIAGPILAVTLVVGLLISIFQVITQIQEMTLTFVPKIIAVVGVLFVFGSWMLASLIEYASELYRNIPQLIH